MLIPSCISLDSQQKEKLEKFEEFVLSEYRRNTVPGEEDDGDCCGSSNFTFHLFGSGIGDSLWVTGYGWKCPLSIDDDGNIIEGWERMK